MNKRFIVILFILFVVTFFGTFVFLSNKEKEKQQSNENNTIVENKTSENNTVVDNESFDFKIIKKASENRNSNYMVSPLSIGYALSMVRDGAEGNTYDEIDKLLGDYKLPIVQNVENRIGIANAMFINEKNKDELSKDYMEQLNKKYDAEIIFDPFKGPENVNNWVSKKTFKMINKTLDILTPDELIVLVNTIAIDVEWQTKFDAENTREQEFTLTNGTKMKTAMMYGTDIVNYISNDNAVGIVKDYEDYNGTELEYIAILPNGDISEYIKNFDKKELDSLLSSSKAPSDKLEINVSLPKYKFDYKYEEFKNDLIDLGMKDAFGFNANFNKIGNGIYISDAIHKTHIEVAEDGTKAAAVTAIIMKYNSMIPEEKEKINVVFDKPFIYLIKDKKSDNIWFFGTVYEPSKWEETKKEK